MSKVKQKEYYFSLIPIIIGWIFTILLIAIIILFSIFLVYKSINDFNEVKDIWYLILLASTIFLLLTLFVIENIQRLSNSITCFFKKIPAIILSHDELIDNLNKKRYEWDEIKDISIVSIMQYRAPSVKVIAIILKDSESLIKSIRNPYKRFNAKQDQNIYGTSYLLNTTLIKCKRQILFEEIKEYLDNYRDLKNS